MGLWTSSVADQYVEWVMPQTHGLHIDTEWFELRSSSSVLSIGADRPFPFAVRHHSEDDLTVARHAHELATTPPTATHVHLDAAHRGLGTAACGPDTHPRHRLGPGVYRWSWRLSAAPVSTGRRGVG
jgi:beta-galactosidase